MILSRVPESLSCPVVSEVFRDQIKQFFQQYSSSYLKKSNPDYKKYIELKQIHIEKVTEEISWLGTMLGMNKEQIRFAEIIALLHDIGRFEQYDRYETFADAESENHSEIAVRIIRTKDILNDIVPQLHEVIISSILNHNIPVIPDSVSPLVDFYSRLLRDADKLDIWRITIENDIFHKINTETLPDFYEVPDRLLKCFEHQRIILLDGVDSLYDSILFRVSWIFDINFIYTLKSACERKVIDKLLAKLPFSDRISRIKKLIDEYINTNVFDGNEPRHKRLA